jgi:hypothetical protein
MEIVNQRLIWVISGDLRLEIKCSKDGTPEDVRVLDVGPSCYGTSRDIYNGGIRELEQAAAVLARIRSLVGDSSNICRLHPEHGYVEQNRECPVCLSNRPDWVEAEP